MRNEARLDALNQQHRHVTPAELSADYLPEAASYEVILSWLTANGIVIERTHSSRLSIDAAASVARLSRVLGLHFSDIQAADGRRFVSANNAPSVPEAIAGMILGINRLQPQLRPHKLIVRGPAAGVRLSTPAPPSSRPISTVPTRPMASLRRASVPSPPSSLTLSR